MPDSTSQPRMSEIVLSKGSQRFVFRYPLGQEDKCLDSLIAATKNNGMDFEWFDAAIISLTITQSLILQAGYLLRGQDFPPIVINLDALSYRSDITPTSGEIHSGDSHRRLSIRNYIGGLYHKAVGYFLK